jgi:uncharacterized membrane protein YfcA
VAVSASAGFIFGMSNQNIDFKVVGGLLLGGVLMAPIAAKLAGRLPQAPFGVLIGGAVLFINTFIILNYFSIGNNIKMPLLILILLTTATLAYFAWQREKKST